MTLINREDAIECVERGKDAWEAIDQISRLPSAELPKGDLISRADALMELNGVCSNWQDDAKVAEIIRSLPSAKAETECIAQIKVDVDEIVERIKEEYGITNKWIPCSERLPEKSGQYCVSGGDKVWICKFLIIPNFMGGWCNDASNPVVQAWMPLPKPYKAENDEV